MPARRRPRARKAPRRGGGAIGDMLKKAHSLIKQHKVVSRLAPALMNMNSRTAPYAARVGQVAAAAGYGRRRRVRRRVGKGKVWDWIKGAAGKVNDFLKQTKVLSKVAGPVLGSIPRAAPYANTVTNTLGALGYGRRRRAPVRRGRGVPIGLPAGVPQGAFRGYDVFPYATNPSRARF